MPIINELISQNCNVIIASSGRSARFLEAEFPELMHISLPKYPIKFNRIISINIQVLLNYFKIKRAIRKEHFELKKILNQYKIHGLISDNRYGIYSAEIPSVIITHQITLSPGTPLKYFGDSLIGSALKNFNQCWIPDEEGSVLSGEMSLENHPEKIYLGLLSRFKTLSLPKENFILALISGTEPHRTIFENKIIKLFKSSSEQVILVRGLPTKNKLRKIFPKNFKVHEHLNSKELNLLLSTCKYVISRNGYTTLMDISMTQTPSVLITTKGQSEQVYLRKHLKSKLDFPTFSLSELSESSLLKASALNIEPSSAYQRILKYWISDL